MSGLSDLIKINKNIEAQNEEIIRLLRIIAGEDEAPAVEEQSEEETEEVEEVVENLFTVGELDEGEVYLLEGEDVFLLSVKEGETSLDNLTGSGEIGNYALAETALKQMSENDISFSVPTVILNDSVNGSLPKALSYCVDIGVKKVYIPIKASIELLGAPQELQYLLDMEVYKDQDSLIEKVLME